MTLEKCNSQKISEQKTMLSLCIPTNGVKEWVLPVLESIYSQKVSEDLYEVIVMDNGDNADFKKSMTQIVGQHTNLKYYETEAKGFLGQIESFKKATGSLIKFVNHRMCLLPGSIESLLKYIQENQEEKPITYFANGRIRDIQTGERMNDFDSFVNRLSYWSSWSAGMAVWKEDFDHLPEGMEFHYLFPHISILFSVTENRKYYIDNRELMEEIVSSSAAKGSYNLFRAFGIEYPGILLDLYRQNKISIKTFVKVKQDNFVFLTGQYFEFVVMKQKCSYSLDHAKEYVSVFYSYRAFRKQSYCSGILRYAAAFFKRLIKK